LATGHYWRRSLLSFEYSWVLIVGLELRAGAAPAVVSGILLLLLLCVDTIGHDFAVVFIIYFFIRMGLEADVLV